MSRDDGKIPNEKFLRKLIDNWSDLEKLNDVIRLGNETSNNVYLCETASSYSVASGESPCRNHDQTLLKNLPTVVISNQRPKATWYCPNVYF